MIAVFDLDDTLYNEISFVKSGFNEVSKLLSKETKLNKNSIYKRLIQILNDYGRGEVFDIFLKENNLQKKKFLSKCLSVYRSHKPKIELYNDSVRLLSQLYKKPYIVTDGNKLVQKNKIIHLGLQKQVKKAFITHNYGLKHAKPSIYCFNKIKVREKIDWSEMIYVGDNPFKDFVNLNKLGVKTVRIMRGPYKNVRSNDQYDAKYHIKNLLQVIKLFKQKI
tara:strand:+ start:1727 stop:2389 length:663 start_codon:yes stop_codon:yes gene_type:complete